MEAVNKKIITEKKAISIRAEDVMSILTILFLSCVIIIFSALICDLVIRIVNKTPHTIIYREVFVEEEPTVLEVDF